MRNDEVWATFLHPIERHEPPRTWSRKVRVFFWLCIMAVVFGALVALAL